MDAPAVQYATTTDGFDIACTTSGTGRDFVLMPYLFNSLSFPPPPQVALTRQLEATFRVVRYDHRGQGLSTRGLGAEHTLNAYERDLEAVVGRLQLRQFILLAPGVFSHAGLRYALQHPGEVSALILWRTALRLKDVFPSALVRTLAAENWDIFLESFQLSNSSADTSTPEDRRVASRAMKAATTQEDWLACVDAALVSSVESEAPRLTVPTLVLADGRTTMTPSDAASRLAARIPNARLGVPDPEAGVQGILDTMNAFISGLPGAPEGSDEEDTGLSARELEVLRLIAAGRSNAQIAEALVISPNTVGRHVSNIFDKIGAANRAEAAAYALRHGLA
jgi:DNA-binding CsgD family transcriptional regulator